MAHRFAIPRSALRGRYRRRHAGASLAVGKLVLRAARITEYLLACLFDAGPRSMTARDSSVNFNFGHRCAIWEIKYTDGMTADRFSKTRQVSVPCSSTSGHSSSRAFQPVAWPASRITCCSALPAFCKRAAPLKRCSSLGGPWIVMRLIFSIELAGFLGILQGFGGGSRTPQSEGVRHAINTCVKAQHWPAPRQRRNQFPRLAFESVQLIDNVIFAFF